MNRATMARHGRQRAFTLVELLVVIAIISVLASLLLPALENAISQARRITCLGNMRQQGTLLSMYADNEDGWGPTGADHGYNGWWRLQFTDVTTLFEDTGVLICPDQDPEFMAKTNGFVPGEVYRPTASNYLVSGYAIYFGTATGVDTRNIHGWNVTGGTPALHTKAAIRRLPAANFRHMGTLMKSHDPGMSTCYVNPPSTQPMMLDFFSPIDKQLKHPGFYINPSHIGQGGENIVYGDGHGAWLMTEDTSVVRWQNFNNIYFE